MRNTIGLWLTILVLSLGLCLIGGYLTYWIWSDVLLAKIVGLALGVIGIITAYKIWEG